MKLEAHGVGCDYGRRQVLHCIDLSLAPGEVVALLGPNGAGKSTLLRCLLGLAAPARGSVTLAGRPLSDYPRRELARHLAYVPQAHVAPFPYSVRQVVMLGRLPHGGPWASVSSEDQRRVAGILDRLGIAHLAERAYTEVSGGERQLALIGRALAQAAPLVVMDEPATGLDYGNQWRLLQLARSLADEGLAFLMSTHTPEHAAFVASRVALLHGGRLIADAPPRDAVTPANIRQLYGIEVELQVSPCGDPRKLALFPKSGLASDDTARRFLRHPQCAAC
jgi:iron complex transport system ATP-binding protein